MGLTEIEWCDYTFNHVVGCTKVSPGCKFCYAEVDTPARVARSQGVELWGPTGQRRIKPDKAWGEIHRWDRAAEAAGVNRTVFIASQCDWLEDREDTYAATQKLLRTLAATPNLIKLLLTKRPENFHPLMRRISGDPTDPEAASIAAQWLNGTAPVGTWFGVSAESQDYLIKRVAETITIAADGYFVSAEPLLGPLDLAAPVIGYCKTAGRNVAGPCGCEWKCEADQEVLAFVDWVIVGGESGANARPCETPWVNVIIDQCAGTDTACFVKQLGSNPVLKGEPIHLSHKKGGDPLEWPHDLRVREFPEW